MFGKSSRETRGLDIQTCQQKMRDSQLVLLELDATQTLFKLLKGVSPNPGKVTKGGIKRGQNDA